MFDLSKVEGYLEGLALALTKVSVVTIILIFGSLASAIFIRNLGFDSVGFNALAPVLAVWVVYLVLVDCEYRDEHIKVAYFYEHAPERVQRAVDTFYVVMVILSGAIIAYAGFAGMIANKKAVTQVLSIPYAFLYAPILIGFAFLSVSTLVGALSEGDKRVDDASMGTRDLGSDE